MTKTAVKGEAGITVIKAFLVRVGALFKSMI